MTKIISILIIVMFLLGAWKLYSYWQQVKAERENSMKEAVTHVVRPEQLPGMPPQLQPSLEAAEHQGAAALQSWLKTYGKVVQDPRRAWIELDYCVMISRSNPAEAKHAFALIKSRTPHSSPVWPRIQELAKSYE